MTLNAGDLSEGLHVEISCLSPKWDVSLCNMSAGTHFYPLNVINKHTHTKKNVMIRSNLHYLISIQRKAVIYFYRNYLPGLPKLPLQSPKLIHC